MSDEQPLVFPLLPSHSASVTQGLCMALVDLIQDEAGGETPRRPFLKMCAIATAAELVSRDLSHFFGSRMGEDHDLLEALEERYLADAQRRK